jgi:maleylacetoacetate isomerase
MGDGRIMKLHGYFRSSASFRVRIALNLKRIDYESVAHHLRRNEQRAPEFLALNPQGFVPALDDEGDVLTQSMAIIEYLDETQPNPPFLPGHPGDRARVRALAQLIACDIHPINNLRVLRYLKDPLGQDEAAVQRWYNHWIAEGFAAFEALIAEDDRTGEFCHGDEPGLADICLVPQVVNSQNYALDLTPYPTLRRIHDRCMTLDAFQRAHPKRQPDAE